MPTQPHSTDTYRLPPMSQEDVDARFAEIVHADAKIADLERDVVAAYELLSDDQPATRSNEQIGSIAFDTARQETYQPAEHILDPTNPEKLDDVQLAARATAAVIAMREDYTLGA